MPDILSLADEHATEAAGRNVAAGYQALRAELGQLPASVIHLHGDLGAGKTTLVRGLLRAMGVAGRVRSPTYTLIDTYELPDVCCVHVDLYRLRSSLEVEELALRDMLCPGTLMAIEWPDKGGSLVPPPDLALHLSYTGETRELSPVAISELGGKWLRLLNVTRA